VKFLVDAQLPRRLARWLCAQGCDAIHTLDLPAANTTPDAEVIACAEREQRIVVTEDADFVQSFIVSGRPPRLWLISTGNVRNDALEALIAAHFPAIQAALATARFIELSRDALIVHG
jgi:predicted nuclease of predicted toxin-antitoxin system